MADYKFDGKELRDRRGKVAVIDGKYFRSCNLVTFMFLSLFITG